MLPTGKLNSELLNSLLSKYIKKKKTKKGTRVIQGPKAGIDVAVIDFGDRYLVSKTDPITFATNEIGYYAINVNANDLLTSGTFPQWFQATVLVPPGSTQESLEKIFEDLWKAADELSVEIIGGHTEITASVTQPVVIGSMFGDISKDEIILSGQGKPGDSLIITKGIAIEGSALIALEKEKDLISKGMDSAVIEHCKKYLHDPGISIYKEVKIIMQSGIRPHTMHDPTEGGLNMGCVELASVSNCGCVLDLRKIPIIEHCKALCSFYGINPMRLITSGTLICAVASEDAENLVHLLKKNNIDSSIIGYLTEKEKGYKMIDENGIMRDLEYGEKDEILKIF
jgi:hydrogenase expression/formation protein HypE